MNIGCPKCDARLSVGEEIVTQADKRIRCPGCKHVFAMREVSEFVDDQPAAAEFGPAAEKKVETTDSYPTVPAVDNAVAPSDPSVRTVQMWRVDRPEYEDRLFSMNELEIMAKRGGILRSFCVRKDDGVQSGPETDWRFADEVPELEGHFAIQDKLRRKRLEAVIDKALNRKG